VPGVLACSGHIEKDELVAVSVAMERPDGEGGWFVGVTRGTTLSSEHAKSRETLSTTFLNLCSYFPRFFVFCFDVNRCKMFSLPLCILSIYLFRPKYDGGPLLVYNYMSCSRIIRAMVFI
jgi:hypothetical protein